MRIPWLILPILLTACAAAPPLPDSFRTGRDPRFPPERFILGTGEGPGLEVARKQAVAAISAQLRASLHATDRIFASSDGRGGDVEQMQQEIRVESRFERPEWIRTVDARAHEGRIHVLCALDRDQAAALLASEQELRRATLRLRLEQAGDSGDLRTRNALLQEAAVLARALLPAEAMLATLRGRPGAPPAELALVEAARLALERDRRSIAVRVCVEPAIDSGIAADLAARLPAILAGTGMQVAGCDAAAPSWTLRGRIVAETSFNPPQPGAHRRFCSVRLDYSIEGPDGPFHGGSAGGARSRFGGNDFHEACQASAAALALAITEEVGLRDPPGQRLK